LNGWFSSFEPASDIMPMQYFQRCERTQHKLAMAGLGSDPTFAAYITKVCFAVKITRFHRFGERS